MPDDISPEERLAVRLFAAYEVTSGDIWRGVEWLSPTMAMDSAAIAAWKWTRMGQDRKDAWLAVAEVANQLLRAPQLPRQAGG